MRKKKSERGRMWEVGEGRRGDGGGEDGEGEKVVLCCISAVAREAKRATYKSIAAARFTHTRYC